MFRVGGESVQLNKVETILELQIQRNEQEQDQQEDQGEKKGENIGTET
jgi:hypothetical protein